MEPVELTLARYRTADLREDARTYRVAVEARRSRVPAVLPTAADALVARVRSTVGATAALVHRLAPAGPDGGQVCCA